MEIKISKFFLCKLLNSGLSGQPDNFALVVTLAWLVHHSSSNPEKCVEGVSSQPKQFEEKALCVLPFVSKHELVSFLLSGLL